MQEEKTIYFLFPTDFAGAALGRVIDNTAPFDYTGHPALTLDAGYSTEGLLVGVMLVGRSFGEVNLLKVAYAMEQVLKK